MHAITYLTGLSLLLILGILASIVARKTRVSSILLYVLVGIILANLGLQGVGIFTFPSELLVSLSLLTLAMIVFDGSSRFTLTDLDKQSNRALELVIVFIVSNILILGTGTMLFFLEPTVQGFLLAILFAVVMAGTDPGSVFVMLGETKHKVLDFLRLEAVLNTPLVVIIPFLLMDIIQGVSQLSVTATFTELIVPFIQNVIVGVGTGMIIGIIVFRVMRKHYSKRLSPLVILASTVLTYVLAENLSGDGVVAVATLGLLFGNTYVKRKGRLTEFSNLLATALEILVFLLVGMLVIIDFNFAFFLKSLGLFAIAVFARYVAVIVALHKTEFKLREKFFMTLHMPKGIAIAVVTFAFSLSDIHMNGLLTLMILFVVYSLILGSVTDRFGKYFIRKEIIAEPEAVVPIKTVATKPQKKEKKK